MLHAIGYLRRYFKALEPAGVHLTMAILWDGETGYTFDAQAADTAQTPSSTMAGILPGLKDGKQINEPYRTLIDNARILIETYFSAESITEELELAYDDVTPSE